MTLDLAKHIASVIENEAKRMGAKVVISIANKDGVSILTQMMDDAFFISKGLAEKKAFTSAALQMPTMNLRHWSAKEPLLKGWKIWLMRKS